MESLKRKRRSYVPPDVSTSHKRMCVDKPVVLQYTECMDNDLIMIIQNIIVEYDRKLAEVRNEFQQEINIAIQSTRKSSYTSTYIS